jgi:hypothetical protein
MSPITHPALDRIRRAPLALLAFPHGASPFQVCDTGERRKRWHLIVSRTVPGADHVARWCR